MEVHTAAQPTVPGIRLVPFYLGITALYGANQLLVLTARWGIAAAGGSAATGGTPLLLAATVVLPMLPQIGVGFLGPERTGGRRPLHATALLGAVAVGGAAALSWAPGGSGAVLAALLLAATLFGGWANALAVPGSQAALMQTLPKAQRVRGSRDFEIASRLPTVLAPIAGGALIAALGVRPALAGVAVLLGLAAAAFFSRRTTGRSAPLRAGLALHRSLHVLRDDPWLRAALVVRGISNLFWPAYMIGLPLLVLDRLHGGAGSYGGLLALYGASVLTAAALSGRLRRAQLRRIYFVSWAVTGGGFVLVATAPTLPLAALGVILAGAGSPYVHMALDTHIGTEVAPEDQTALFAFQRLVIGAMSLLGSLAAAWLLTRATPAQAIGLAGILLAAAGLGGGFATLAARAREGTPAGARRPSN